MAIVDKSLGGTKELPYEAGRGFAVLKWEWDFAKDGPATAADVWQVIRVPDNSFVMRTFTNVIRAEGSAGNIDVGDGATVDGYQVDTNVNSVAVTSPNPALTEGTPNTLTRYTFGKFYATSDTIDIIPSINLVNARIEITALVFHLGVAPIGT